MEKLSDEGSETVRWLEHMLGRIGSPDYEVDDAFEQDGKLFIKLVKA